MNTLNIVNKSPFEKKTLEQCLKRIGAGDSVLLIEDAAISAVSGTAHEPQLLAAAADSSIYVLQADLDARGFSEVSLINPIKSVDYSGFVDLVAEHDRVHSWL